MGKGHIVHAVKRRSSSFNRDGSVTFTSESGFTLLFEQVALC